MANIRPIYEDAARTTQVYPQTHERAVVDNNGTTAETKFGLLQEAYAALTQSDIVVVADHTAVSSPQANTIYREQGTTTYSDWMYYGSAWKKMAEYDNAIDDVPKADSNNLVKSGGVAGIYIGENADHGKNLLDLVTMTNNRYLNTSGSLSSASNCKVSNYIDVTFVKKANYRLRRSTANDIYTIVAYDENKTMIPENSVSGTHSSSGAKEGTWTKAEGTKFVRCTIWKDSASQYFISTLSLPDIQEWVDSFEDNYITGTETGQYNLGGRVSTLETEVSTLDEEVLNLQHLEVEIHGGTAYEKYDGKKLASISSHYYCIQNDKVTSKAHNSWRRFSITNKEYETIKVKTWFNASLGEGISAVILLLFKVDSTFVFDETKGYIQNENYVYYPSCTFTTAQDANWFWLSVDGSTTIEIPEGTTSIGVCCRNTNTTNAEIILDKHAVLNGLSNDVDDLRKAVENDSGTVNSVNTNNDQDSLLLRNYIKTTWPYYFDASTTVDSYDALPYLDKKIKDIPDGKHFIFLTDTHWQDSPAKPTSTYIASYVSKRLGGCTTVFGGDCINSASNKYLAARAFSNYADEFYSAFGDTGLWVQGNHDSNRLGIGSGVTAADALIDDTEVYKRSVARIAHKVVFDQDSINAIQNIGFSAAELANAEAWLKLHYHWDDTANKVRYIIYETGCGGVTMHDFVRSGTSYMLPLEYIWVSKTLLSTPDDYDIVVLGHMFGGSTSSYTSYSSGNTDSRVIMKLFRAFKTKSSISVNMRTVNTTSGTAFTKAICGTKANRTFDFTTSKHSGRMFIVSGHWHNDRAFMCRYYTDIDGVEGQNGVNVQLYDAEDVTEDTVIHINVACDTTSAGRNSYYTSRSTSMVGSKDEILFDVITLTDDDKVVCTRIGYGNDRVFNLTGVEQDYDDDDDGNSSGSDTPEESGEIINS